ncbi:hypothetical protein DSM104299_02477 [Baekduia alba]|uniref:hypothetical protein n=1 Tax=Baekduia alba TaxID=2997333 RepID=UPI00233FEA50|nr:hypothetical protein [Baekduia alba]WCB93761.1 hypothetical protein DSM104299_02477 [Baekduia alba]
MRRSSGALLCLLAAIAALLAPAAAGADGLRDPLSVSPLASLTSGPPVNVGVPTVAGTLIEGQTLVAASGSWNPSATSATYQWQRDTGSGYADISGATATTYTLLAADVGASLRVHVVATNASGSGAADADGVGPIIAGDPVNTVTPVIAGNLQGGSTLIAGVGSWHPAGTSYSFKWQRDSGSGYADIAGATAMTYTTVPADVTASIRVRVTAVNGFASVVATSNVLGPITTGKPASVVAPVITGTAKRGVALAANSGSWSPAPTSYAYQWQTDAGSGYVDIAGATSTSYTPVGGDLGHPLQVVVTATNSFGSTAATSAATAAVAADPPVNVGTPSIAGTAKRTFTLTGSAGSWSPAGAAFTYQWQRDTGSGFADISGATASSYTLVTADVGATVRVRVKATNVDGNAVAASAQTAAVAAATPGSSVAPAITQANRIGEAVTTSDGSWNPAAASYAYQWQRRVAGSYVDISGATSRTYTLVTADVGTTIRSKVTATNADGTGAGYSAASPTIVAPPVPPTTIAAPAGTLTDTNTLTIAPGVWTPSATTLTYQWLRCPAGATAVGGCVTIGAGQSYTLVGPDVAHTIAVRVTGMAGGVSTVATSTFTADVTGRALTLVTAPAISGTVEVAATVHAVPALWSVPTLTERYQWQRCAADGSACVDIAGATRPDYKVAVADKTHALVVHETATSWGRTSTADSTFAVVDDQPLPGNVDAPLVTGTAKRTGNLQVARGSWANNPTGFSYSWQRCASDGTGCAAIAGETRANHILSSADVGHTIRGAVTATNTEGSVLAVSAPTAVVAAVLPQLLSTGAIHGTLQVPQMIQAYTSSWSTTPDTRFAYQWQRCDAAGANCVDIVGARTQAYRLQTADARARLRVVHVATNPDGSTSAATPVTAAILPAPPGVTTTPRLSGVGRTDVGKTLTLTPGRWSAATEITTKTLEFWRCSPRCVSLPTNGAGSYVLTDADAGALIRGSETAVGPGGTVVSWAASWLGPVHSAAVATSSFAVSGGSRSLTTSKGLVLARVTVGSGAHAAAAAAPPITSSGARSVRIALRRAKTAPHGARLRAWACLAKPSATGAVAPCTKAVWLKTTSTLKLAVPKGQRLRVVVVRKRR